MSEKNQNELAVNAGFAVLANQDVLNEALADDCQGLEFSFDRVKLPAGGGTAFEIPSADGEDAEMAKDITGVIVYNHPAFAYYHDKYNGGSNPPDCGSFDGVSGIGNPGGSCHNCPYNKFGSGDGQSKLCKNKRMLYILREGELFPITISLPTGSLKTFTNCGGWYGAKVWHSTDQYRKVIYRCNHKYKNEKCQTPHVTEEEVKELFIKAYNELFSEKKEIIENAEIIRKTLCKTESMIEEKQRLEDEILVLVEMTQNLVAENARVAQDQNEYQKRYDGLVQRYETAKKSYDDLVAKIEQKEAHGERIKQFIKNLKEQQCVLAEFDDALWGSMVEYVTIGKENRSVTFKDGTEITVE